MCGLLIKAFQLPGYQVGRKMLKLMFGAVLAAILASPVTAADAGLGLGLPGWFGYSMNVPGELAAGTRLCDARGTCRPLADALPVTILKGDGAFAVVMTKSGLRYRAVGDDVLIFYRGDWWTLTSYWECEPPPATVALHGDPDEYVETCGEP